MKISFAIPDEIGRRFKRAVPVGQRSAVVTNLLKRTLRIRHAQLEQVCDRVNRLAQLENEMIDWTKFDDTDA